MRRANLAACGLLVAAVGLAGCMPPADRAPPLAFSPRYVVGEPYQVGGVWFYPREEVEYEEVGLAVAAPADAPLRVSANGEPFDQTQMLAAHPTLQLPAILRVTNLSNGRSVVVRLNERGPEDPARRLLLTARAAELLALAPEGAAPVRITMISDASRVVAAQLQPLRMAALASGDTTAPAEVRPTAAPRPSVVVIGRESAAAPPSAVRPLQMPADLPGSTAPDGRFLPDAVVTESAVARAPRLFVEAGTFEQFNAANRLRARLSHLGPADVQQTARGRTPRFVVRFGPLPDVSAVDGLVAAVRATGQENVRVAID